MGIPPAVVPSRLEKVGGEIASFSGLDFDGIDFT
jgi:hypothetical protein